MRAPATGAVIDFILTIDRVVSAGRRIEMCTLDRIKHGGPFHRSGQLTSGESFGFSAKAHCDEGVAFRQHLCQPGTSVDINHPLGFGRHSLTGGLLGGSRMESNARYYSRRAVEERMAAQRAMTDAARAWHAKLAEDFAQRASIQPNVAVNA
jgi:hypothetical protein